MFRKLILAAFLSAPIQAQIYADLTVSSGGAPLGTFRIKHFTGNAENPPKYPRVTTV
jgi:hypothetical protein